MIALVWQFFFAGDTLTLVPRFVRMAPRPGVLAIGSLPTVRPVGVSRAVARGLPLVTIPARPMTVVH